MATEEIKHPAWQIVFEEVPSCQLPHEESHCLYIGQFLVATRTKRRTRMMNLLIFLFINSDIYSNQLPQSNMQSESNFLFHGSLASQAWEQPKLIANSQQISRPGYSPIKAKEYQDKKQVIISKIQILAQLIKASQSCVIYTGAGVSRAAGIADYASKAKNSVAGKQNPSLNRLNAEPTYAHHLFVAMEKKGYTKHWLQQNHDGLAQKAGFPTSKLNQIHGSWFDKKNPVVMMDDKLNKKNYEMLREWQDKADLCIAVGTSLCGMRSDGIAQKCAQKNRLVIINLQCTPYDEKSCIRIYGNLQEVCLMLGKQLKLKVETKICISNPYQWVK